MSAKLDQPRDRSSSHCGSGRLLVSGIFSDETVRGIYLRVSSTLTSMSCGVYRLVNLSMSGRMSPVGLDLGLGLGLGMWEMTACGMKRLLRVHRSGP